MIPIVRHRGSDPSRPPASLFRTGDEVHSIDRPGQVGIVDGLWQGLVCKHDDEGKPVPVVPGPQFVNPGYMGGHWIPVSYRVRFGDGVTVLSEDFLTSTKGPDPLPLPSPFGTFAGKPVHAASPPIPCSNCGESLYQVLHPGGIDWLERGPGEGEWMRHRSCLRRTQ